MRFTNSLTGYRLISAAEPAAVSGGHGPRHRQSRPAPTAAPTATAASAASASPAASLRSSHEYLQLHPGRAAWRTRQSPCAAKPGDRPFGSASETDESSSPSHRASDRQAPPRPPISIPGVGGGTGQSERAADAAAEAVVAEAAARHCSPQHQQQHHEQEQDPQPSRQPRVSDFRSSPRISAALDAAAELDTATAAVVTEAVDVDVSVERPPSTVAAAAPSHLHLHATHNIEEFRTHPHEFTCKEPNTCGGTIVVALDDTDDAAAAVEWVAKNLYTPGADELRVVHVVCDPRTLQWQTSLGTTASGREIAISSLDLGLGPAVGGASYGGVEVDLQDYLSRLNAAAELVVRRRCEGLRLQGIQYETDLPRLPAARSAACIAETLLDVVQRHDAKLLVVASHGPGALAEFGSVSRFCYQHSNVPLLLIPSIEAQEAACADAAAAAAAPAAPAAAAAAPAAPTAAEILLVVNHLEELANVWQWVADNCARKGDTLSIWHVAGPSVSGMPSLPTAIANQLRGRGLGNVSYRQLYSSTGDPRDLGEQVCRLAAGNPAVKLVVLLNYSRRGLLQEALHGSVSSHLSRYCSKPLLLLQLPE